MKYKALLIILLLLISSAYALEWQSSGELAQGSVTFYFDDSGIWNQTGNVLTPNTGTTINITGSYYGDGSQLTGIISNASNTTNFWDIYDVPSDIQNLLTIPCGNISGATSNLCTIVDTDTDTQKTTSGLYLYNDTTTIFFNETKLNATIDARENDTTYTENNIFLTLIGTVFGFNDTLLNSTIDARSINIDTNETPRFDNLTGTDCGGTDKVTGVTDLGVVVCASDIDTDTQWTINTTVLANNSNTLTIVQSFWDNLYLKITNFFTKATGTSGYLYNDSNTIFFNETKLNATIDNRDSDTTYTASGTLLDLTTTIFSLNEGTLTNNRICTYVTGTGIVCTTTDSDTTYTAEENYIYLDSTTFRMNETVLNATIDDRDADTTYSEDNLFLTLAATVFGFDNALLNSTIDARSINSVADVWVNETGDTMTGNLSMGANFIKFDSNKIYIGNISDSSPLIDDDVFGVYLENDGVTLPHFVVQSGGVSQASYIMRSFMIVNEEVDFFNTSNRTDCSAYMTQVGETLKIDCNTSTSGADLIVGDDMQVVGDIWVKDTDGEWHFTTRELELLDEQRRDTLMDKINVTLTGTNLSIKQHELKNIVVNIEEVNYNLGRTQEEINLTAGTNITPQFNHIYYDSAPNPVLTKSLTEQTMKANVFKILAGENGYEYASIVDNAELHDFNREIIERISAEGSIYIGGFTQNVTTTEFNISGGVMIVEVHKEDMPDSDLSSTDQLIHVLSNGSFFQGQGLDNLAHYQNDGSNIGNNKYFNVVFGIVHTIDNVGRLYAVIQDDPTSGEYTTLSNAEIDVDNAVNIFPANSFVKKLYIPIARVVMKRAAGTNTIQTLSNGQLFFDLRGTTISSGGNSPSPSITEHQNLGNLNWASAGHTFDTGLNTGAFSVTAAVLVGDINCSHIKNATSNLCTITDTTYSLLSEFDNDVGFFDSEDNITCTSISGLSADLCDNGDANTQLSDADILGLGYNHTSDIQTWVNANDADTTYDTDGTLILSSTTFSHNDTYTDGLYYTQAVADAAFAALGGDQEVTIAGENITSGTVADARIASTIARDSEVIAANASAVAWADAQDIIFNDSQTAYGDGTFITLVNEGNLNVASATTWASMTSVQSKWFADVGNVLTFDEAELNLSIE